ncbi:hypothetical protein GUITHDRAFT_115084 [Guillardia theta CCMP2712]|uniref:SAP domain-containing protein n=1 Tax=Guillardia theta (strain CCMP2712) TaxID=905079 RepID=L1IR52_GUITC|nr:hypothetical protein GUITHDRAFT_115084 [Guillardia theta CCMP2712]EKX38756.1 hypothetical protein GUITHDRAFT_115084 [Guillardia theta CCMP2712]|eukprot:XP_005825736.1 hypothetical protein GUITHDRAFT_115084 [Guillardia theta CCMP2712]
MRPLRANTLSPAKCDRPAQLSRVTLPLSLPRRGWDMVLMAAQAGDKKANWRPLPSDSLTFSEEEEEEEEDDLMEDSDDEFEGDGREQVIMGAGALRGEQDLYSMRDLQSMKVPRLRSMCEARGLKKNGTKAQLINRLLASTVELGDSATPTPSRLNPKISSRLSSSASSGSSPVSVHALGGGGRRRWIWSSKTGLVARSIATRVEEVDDQFRPSGEALEKILQAPKIVRRAGVTITMHSSKIVKYQADIIAEGSKISSLDSAQVSLPAPEAKPPAAPQAKTLNGIPREFLPPSLRSFDPSASSKKRGPGRPRQDDNDEDSIQNNDWELVKSGGGMSSSFHESPFDAMIRADEEEEARLNPKKKRGKAKKKVIIDEDIDDDEDLPVPRSMTRLVEDDDDGVDLDDEMPDVEDDEYSAVMPDFDEDIEENDDDDDDDESFKTFLGDELIEDAEPDEAVEEETVPMRKRVIQKKRG